MNSRLTYQGIAFLFIIVIIFLRCGKDNGTIENEQLKSLLNKSYPKAVEKEYNLVVRYESKESPESWNNFSWKKDNDYLEKKGLLKQTISDTLINFYDHSHLKFINKQHYLYKVKMSSELKSLISDPQTRIQKFDEYDKFNRKTGKTESIYGNAICGQLKLDEIFSVKQLQNSTSEIKYYIKFYPTAFNDIINYENKYRNGESIIHKEIVKKTSTNEIKLLSR